MTTTTYRVITEARPPGEGATYEVTVNQPPRLMEAGGIGLIVFETAAANGDVVTALALPLAQVHLVELVGEGAPRRL